MARDDVLALLNAMRMPPKAINAAVTRKFGVHGDKHLSYEEFADFLRVTARETQGTPERVGRLFGDEDFALPAAEPSWAIVVLWCLFAPLTWPMFVRLRERRATVQAGLGLRGMLLTELILLVGYAPIALRCAPTRHALASDRVSTFECFLPALALSLLCLLKAGSIGLGWFHTNQRNLHLWRRLGAQQRFLHRFERNRILLQRLNLLVFGVDEEELRSVWAYELLQYLEGAYAFPHGLVPSSQAEPGARTTEPARRHGASQRKTGNSPSPLDERRLSAGPHTLLRVDLEVEPQSPGVMADPYYDHEVPDAMDLTTHSLAFGPTLATEHARKPPLYSRAWFNAAVRTRLAPLLFVIAVVSPAIPCLVRWGVHGIPYFGRHAASRFVVLINSVYGACTLLVVLLALQQFLFMLDFRKRLLLGLTATVRPDVAATCGVRVQLILRDAVNLTTWSQTISYLRKRCLSEEVKPFNALLFPALLLVVVLCVMFIVEWISWHMDESLEYKISALDIISGMSVLWLSRYVYALTSLACDINTALEQHSEVLETTQVSLRGAIRELRAAATATESRRGSLAPVPEHVAEDPAGEQERQRELQSLEAADYILTALVRKSRNVDLQKPFKLVGTSITKARLRALGGMLIVGLVSGMWRQIDDVIFTSMGVSF